MTAAPARNVYRKIWIGTVKLFLSFVDNRVRAFDFIIVTILIYLVSLIIEGQPINYSANFNKNTAMSFRIY